MATLVSAHRISSSRFFQTRLSNPLRIIICSFTGSQGDGLFGAGIVDANGGGDRGVQVNLAAIEGLKSGAGATKAGLGGVNVGGR